MSRLSRYSRKAADIVIVSIIVFFMINLKIRLLYHIGRDLTVVFYSLLVMLYLTGLGIELGITFTII